MHRVLILIFLIIAARFRSPVTVMTVCITVRLSVRPGRLPIKDPLTPSMPKGRRPRQVREVQLALKLLTVRATFRLTRAWRAALTRLPQRRKNDLAILNLSRVGLTLKLAKVFRIILMRLFCRTRRLSRPMVTWLKVSLLLRYARTR